MKTEINNGKIVLVAETHADAFAIAKLEEQAREKGYLIEIDLAGGHCSFAAPLRVRAPAEKRKKSADTDPPENTGDNGQTQPETAPPATA